LEKSLMNMSKPMTSATLAEQVVPVEFSHE
jgi:hypothetical protein